MPETTVPCLNESFAIGMVKYGQIIYIWSCLKPSGFETSTHVKDCMDPYGHIKDHKLPGDALVSAATVVQYIDVMVVMLFN